MTKRSGTIGALLSSAVVAGLFVGLWSNTNGQAETAEWFVAAGGSGRGTAEAPLGHIQDALNAAQPGDTITVRPGTYRETLRTVRGGTSGQPILLLGFGASGSIVVAAGRVLTVDHPY